MLLKLNLLGSIMNKIKNNLDNNFWDWLDSVSIKYKNYEIKNAIIAYKFGQLNQLLHRKNTNNFNLRKILSSIKWNLILHLFTNKISSRNKNKIIKKNYDSLCDLNNKNLYAINFSPNDPRHFLHISTLAKKDNGSLVITVRNDVYNYFNKREIPVILLDISIPWRNENDFKINVPLTSLENKLLSSLDLTSLVLLSMSASLIDLLDIITNGYGLPQTLITLQDFHCFDSVFATYFLGKIPTITLQHGMSSKGEENRKSLWRYTISDWIVAFGCRQAEILEYKGVSPKKIKILGTAKYDVYLNKSEERIEIKEDRNRILIGIQQTSFFEENFVKVFNFIEHLLSSKENYELSFRFHPGTTKKNREKFVQRLIKINQVHKMKVNISNIEDPLKDISESNIVLVSQSTLGMEAMLFKKPVIEYLSKKEDSVKFGDYRDLSFHASNGEEAKKLISKLLNDNIFYNKIIEKQNKFVNKEIMLPPAIPRILEFINSLHNNKRSVKNNK